MMKASDHAAREMEKKRMAFEREDTEKEGKQPSEEMKMILNVLLAVLKK